MNEDGPPILRPVPRRPFGYRSMGTTSPVEDMLRRDVASQSNNHQELDMPDTLLVRPALDRTESASSLRKQQSLTNFTSSTLMGIYSEAASNTRDCSFMDYEEADTPWGTGAHTPVRRPSVDEATYQLMVGRSHVPPQWSSLGPTTKSDAAVRYTRVDAAVSLILRGSFLFILGLGYGALVTRLHDEQNHNPPFSDDSIMRPGRNWYYLALWGLAGVSLGSLLPWFDTVWEHAFGGDSEAGMPDREFGPGTDWVLVMRSVGAFVGIIFAIRKLAWVSTLQVAATLALVNPLLWWLIDRSKPGFVLSATVGLTGSILLLGVDPGIMPAPIGLPSRNASSIFQHNAAVLGGLASSTAVETGAWMLSVLFCSCVCFGNIGRRLTWKKSSGRWGGIR